MINYEYNALMDEEGKYTEFYGPEGRDAREMTEEDICEWKSLWESALENRPDKRHNWKRTTSRAYNEIETAGYSVGEDD